MRRIVLSAILLCSSLWALHAWGLSQPGSTTLLPILDADVDDCSDKNVQHCLDEEEGGQTIDAQQDGNITPETFDPSCDLTFHILNRGAGYDNVFGWYNVLPDPENPGQTLAPQVEDLYTFILGDENPPLTRTLALRDDMNYAGGEIGFFIATGNGPDAEIGGPPSNYENLFFSERAHNPPEPNTDEPSIHLIIWQSVTYGDSFYFGWEDKLTDNDNDFDDIFTRVSGIQCAGGGEACDTGEAGVCKDGTMQCQQGELSCVPNVGASDEACNALDDDCNGETDEAEGICPDDYICDRGTCVPPCGTGEFRCNSNYVCNDTGACVDPACVDVECAEGQICQNGECIDGCADVTCPYGHVCRVGVCVDPCQSITCDDGYSCHLGVCTDCDCVGCGTGESCVGDICVEDACAAVTCDTGTHCAGGECLDNCEGTTCPGGAACVDGACEAPPVSGSGGSTGSSGGSGGGIVVGSGGSSAASSGGSAGSSNPVGADGAESDGGCGCRVVTGRSYGSLALWLAASAGFGFAARRRRRL